MIYFIHDKRKYTHAQAVLNKLMTIKQNRSIVIDNKTSVTTKYFDNQV